MRKAYLLVYADSGTRGQVKTCVDSLPEIETWRYDMPHCFYLISEYDADDIASHKRIFW